VYTIVVHGGHGIEDERVYVIVAVLVSVELAVKVPERLLIIAFKKVTPTEIAAVPVTATVLVVVSVALAVIVAV
jgi:hypothetical protein